MPTSSDQSYYWTPEWQAAERAASADIAAGRVETFTDAESAIRWLTETPLPPDQEPPDADTSPEPANDTVEDIDPESETPAGLEPRED